MKIEKIVKQLQREVEANKGRAAALGGCLVVAAYFWAPLVSGWISTEESEGAVADSETAVEVLALPVTAVAIDTHAPEEHSWQDLDRWILEDPRMKSAELSGDRLRPFAKLVLKETKQDEQAEQDAEALAAVQVRVMTPETLGLELTGVLLGTQRSLLQISGKTYSVETKAGDGSTPVSVLVFETGKGSETYRVDRVESRRVILRHGEQTFELRIKGSELAGNGRLRFLPPRE